MKAMVFAAGLGTRLKPITDSIPKALVPVCGDPLLGHVLRKLVASGYDDIVVNVHHFAGQIREYLDSHDFGVRISVSDESDLLRETGGAVRHARPLETLEVSREVDEVLDLGWGEVEQLEEAATGKVDAHDRPFTSGDEKVTIPHLGTYSGSRNANIYRMAEDEVSAVPP